MTNDPYTNTGHGHVWKRPDGAVARCGGPGICKECSADYAALANATGPPSIPGRWEYRTTVRFKRLPSGEGLPLPSYATAGASGIDLHAATFEINDGWLVIGTGFAIEIPPGFEGQLRGRSGLAFKHGALAHFGTIDSDYRGEVKVALFQLGTGSEHIERGDRVCQLVIAPVIRAEVVEVEELSESVRGVGGFGSTGT